VCRAEGEAGDTARGAGVVLPRHGRHVREVAGVRAHRPRGTVVPGAPVPGRRGRCRASAAAAPHLPPARLGQLPRASWCGALLVGGARARRQDRQHAAAGASDCITGTASTADLASCMEKHKYAVDTDLEAMLTATTVLYKGTTRENGVRILSIAGQNSEDCSEYYSKTATSL
jgi:hypothetical protein